MSGFSGPRAQRGPYPLALLLLLLLGPTSVLAISFHLPVNSRKCLREEIHKDLLVTGAYEITDQSGGAGGLRTHLKVRYWVGRGEKTERVGEVAEDSRVRRAEAWRAVWPPGALKGELSRPPPHPACWLSRGGAGRQSWEPIEGPPGLGGCGDS